MSAPSALPEFNEAGDLPPGVHLAPLSDVLARFGTGTPQREAVTMRLTEIYRRASVTGQVQHFLLFGSYISRKPAPNDVDIVLVMQDNFDVASCAEEARTLFDHSQADQIFGASIFWIRPALLFLETLDEFIAHWQIKRDGTRRGIVDVTS